MADDGVVPRVAMLRIGRDGPVRVLLHGFCSNSGTFQNVLPFLRRHGSIVLVDLPGHGRSGVPDYAPLPSNMGRAIVEALRPLALPSFHLVGHSLGGMIATEVAIAMPSQVESLSLIACAGIGRKLNMKFFQAFTSVASPEELLPHLAVAYAVPPPDLAKIGRAIFEWLGKPGVRAFIDRIVDSAPAHRADVAAAVGLGIPVHALWGSDDQIAPVENAQSLPAGVPLDVLHGAGHLAHLENPAEVARWMMLGRR